MQTKVLPRAFSPAWAVVSPYYQAGWGAKQTTMTLKAFILGFTPNATGIIVDLESSDSTIRANITVPFTITYSDTDATIKAGVESAVSARCTGFFGIQAPDIFVWDFTTPTDLASAIAAAAPAAAVINTATRSIVTGTGATGFQVSATRNVFASYSVTIATTATIGGSASGTVVLEVAATNSATAGDWTEVARFTNGQAITLAIALQSVQTLAGQVNGMIPAGYYAKIRSINNSGTPTYTFNSGRETLQ